MFKGFSQTAETFLQTYTNKPDDSCKVLAYSSYILLNLNLGPLHCVFLTQALFACLVTGKTEG